MLSEEDRFEALKEYYPQAKALAFVGKRGSACRLSERDAEKGGVLRSGY